MVNYYIYAKDFSASTYENKHYHINGLKTLEQFKIDVAKIEKEQQIAGEPPPTESKVIYLHWGHECYEVDEEITRKTYMELEGDMNTEPESIIEWIQQHDSICDENNKIKLLYIITDGLIDSSSADKCFALNEHIHYETVVFHAFHEYLPAIDLSVAASFFKSRCLVYRNYELFDNVDISDEFDYDKINVDNFKSEKDNLKSYIKLKYIRKLKEDTIALKEIDKLKNLRKRLFAELLSKPQKRIEVNLDTKDRNVFLREFVRTDWYRDFISLDHEINVDIEKSVSTLINYIISDTKCYSFDALKFDQKFSDPVEEEPIVDVDFAAEQEIEFPDIILDDDKGIPVIIITTFNLLDKIIFHGTKVSADVSPASFNKFKSAMECPLILVNDPDISESIGYFYTLNVYKQLLEHNKKTEPRTRKQFHGGLVLTDNDQFDKYNDYILSATYFDFKKVYYNVGLFYYVLWKNCENKEWMDKNVVEHFKKYAMRRISMTKCKIGLSSLPLDPQVKTSLLSALWYCVELSSSIFKNDSENFMQERLRMFHSVAHYMIEILQYFEYNLDLESIEKRRDLISNVTMLKRIQTREAKVYVLLEKIFKTVNGFLVSVIENPSYLYKLNYLKFYHKGMLSDDIIEEKVHLNEYVNLMHFIEHTSESKGTIEICEKTFRPFFTISQNKSFYTELVNATKKVVINNDDDKDKIDIEFHKINSLEFSKFVSLYNLFIDCVKQSEKYPTFPEYIEHISKKKRFNNELVTIFPSNIYNYAEEVYKNYQKIMTNVDVNEFIKVCKAYVRRPERIKAENILKFNDDKDINVFISSEESKFNLKWEDVRAAPTSPRRAILGLRRLLRGKRPARRSAGGDD